MFRAEEQETLVIGDPTERLADLAQQQRVVRGSGGFYEQTAQTARAASPGGRKEVRKYGSVSKEEEMIAHEEQAVLERRKE